MPEFSIILHQFCINLLQSARTSRGGQQEALVGTLRVHAVRGHGVMASWSMPWRPGGQTPWPLPGAISSKHHDFKLEGTTHTAARDLVTTSKSVDLSHPRCSGFQWFPVVSNFQVFDVFDRLDTIRYLDMV